MPVAPALPVNIDSTYADSGTDASVKLHQQHHDVIHASVNTLNVLPLNTKTANYTLVLADGGEMIEMNAASANTVTVPTNASVAFPIGTAIALRQYGAGTTTVAPVSGTVIIRSRGGLLSLAGQYAEATLTKRATDEWILVGDVA